MRNLFSNSAFLSSSRSWISWQLAFSAWVVFAGCHRSSTQHASKIDTDQTNAGGGSPFQPLTAVQIDALEPSVVGFCGNCHAAPNPLSFVRDDWPREVQRGYDFYFSSGRSDLRVPKSAEVKAYYQTLAPEKAEFTPPTPLDVAARDQFAWQSVSIFGNRPQAFAGAGLCVADFNANFGKGLLLSDMRGGQLLWLPCAGLGTNKPVPELQPVAQLRNPSRIVPGDFDVDGQVDLLVADLGSFLPADHRNGRVLWLRPKQQPQLEFEIHEILTGCGRVADVRAADFDGDGDLDLVVADFGWHETGQVLWLERVAPEILPSSFKPHALDSRPGAMQVFVVDIDGDGDLDVIALIAQEFEAIVAYLNDGRGNFTAHTLFDMQDPASGSSGMDLVDLDRDGDLDIVHTNGDSFDSFHVKSYHGIRWLENQGQLNFVPHAIAAMPGVHRAMPTDVDGDGDIDLVAVAFLPMELEAALGSPSPEAIVIFENDGKQNFIRRPIKVGQATHAAVLVDDLNGDGTVDIAAAGFYDTPQASVAELEIAIAVPNTK